MRSLVIIIEKLASGSGFISGLFVPVMMILIVVEVFMRYVLHSPPMIADEFSAYMLVALSYLGFAYTWRQGGHVRIEILVNRLAPRTSQKIRLLGLILVLIFMVEMDRVAYKMVVYALKMNLRSSTWLMFPLFWPQLTVFLGFVFLTLLIAVDLAKTINNFWGKR
ncbi:MAG: TRAP transporter small permease subunit [Thermodesulfobacteriota bacterium]